MSAAPKQPTLKLSYLDIKGLAEPIRLALAIGGLHFEDERLSYEEVAERRNAGALPFGQVPVLEIDGVAHAQAGALLRWAGARSGLYPTASQLRVDAALEALGDIRGNLRPLWYKNALGRNPLTGGFIEATALSEEQHRGVVDALSTAVLPARLAQLERSLHASGGPYLCGEALTIADLDAFVMIDGIQDGSYCAGVSADVLRGCPGLLELRARVEAHPRVKEWNARDPKQGWAH